MSIIWRLLRRVKKRSDSAAKRYELQRFLRPAPLYRAMSFAIAVAIIALGPIPIKIIFAYFVVLSFIGQLYDRGYVELGSSCVRIRGFQRVNVRYCEIERIEHHRSSLPPTLACLAQRLSALRSPGLAQPPTEGLALLLKRRKWVVIPWPVPLPLVLWKRTVYLYVNPEDTDSLAHEVRERLSSAG